MDGTQVQFTSEMHNAARLHPHQCPSRPQCQDHQTKYRPMRPRAMVAMPTRVVLALWKEWCHLFPFRHLNFSMVKASRPQRPSVPKDNQSQRSSKSFPQMWIHVGSRGTCPHRWKEATMVRISLHELTRPSPGPLHQTQAIPCLPLCMLAFPLRVITSTRLGSGKCNTSQKALERFERAFIPTLADFSGHGQLNEDWRVALSRALHQSAPVL